MKKYVLLAFIALFCVSSSAWAQYVKLTAENGTVSWIEITGIISGSYILLSKDNSDAVIDVNTKGSIDLYEVWSERGGNGIRYRVIIIGTAAFMDCSGLTSVDIPDGVESIEDYAFIGCIGLTSVDIPSSVINIGERAFANCRGLTSVTIPSSVTSIGAFAFQYCMNLTSITSEIRNVFETGENAFSGCDNAILYVPKGLVSTYRSKADWNRISNIQECWFDFCATNADGVTIYYKIVNETNKTCEVTYGIDKSSGSAPTGGYTDYAGVVNIPSSANGYKVIGIGDYAFADCGDLTSVTIPNSVTYIKEYAFESCI